MMHKVWFLLTFWLLSGWLAIDHPRIDSPLPGEALLGVVNITGSTNLKDFQASEVAFAYDQHENQGWFLIQRSTNPVKDSTLAVWDTTTITDGIYRLRVRVILSDGQSADTIISGLRVRNYTAVETNTPVPAQAGVSIATQLPTVIDTPQPTPTMLPRNPAEVTHYGLLLSLVQGVIYAIVFFSLVGIYFIGRNMIIR